jgi:hypothetical protein
MRPSEAGLNVHRERRNRRRVAFQVQRIANAVGRTVNLDVYAVEIAQLPPGMTPASLLDHVRRNLGDFLDPGLGTFSPYGADDRVDWHASGVAPIGSLSIFRVPVWGPVHEQMGVVTSAASSTRWIFSPVRIGSHSPGMHPVSGNREFGVRSMPDGTVQLYTRAADRVAVRVPGENTIFGGGDSLWRSFQDRIRRFVESRGGRARVNKPEFQRPTWDQIQRSGRLRP